MNVLSRSISKDDSEQLRRKDKLPVDRFLSFNKSTLASTENYCCLNKSKLNSSEQIKITLNTIPPISFSCICEQCSKLFASDYGLDYHRNMYHQYQSVVCSECNLKFRSHRALKSHQQRSHSNLTQNGVPDYSYISTYLISAFSTRQFPLITKDACEKRRLPLGRFSSKLFQCQTCLLSFPCAKALKCHSIYKHEQYEYNVCRKILYDIILQVEQNLPKTNDDDDDIDSIKSLLSQQASCFGLIDKELANEYQRIKQQQNQLIYPTCPHQNRTCANLCLNHLSSYYTLAHNHPYKVTTEPKGNPFAHGSIVSQPVSKPSTANSSVQSKEISNTNQKRTSLKRAKSSMSEDLSSPQSKKKLLAIAEQHTKPNETKLIPNEQPISILVSPKKAVAKVNSTYVRSLSSMSSTSTTSTRASSKNTKQQSSTSLKRSVSPTIVLAVERSAEKRRQQREQRKAKMIQTSNIVTKSRDDIEQENDEDDSGDGDNNNNIVSTSSEHRRQQRRHKRQASNSSVEYVQVLHHNQQAVPSLNNIENLKVQPKANDDDIIICNSSPSTKKVNSSSNRDHSDKSANVNGMCKTNTHQTTDYDENVRVRCKICGDILQGRSRFSQHVLTMHSHLVKSNISTIKQQPTTVVR